MIEHALRSILVADSTVNSLASGGIYYLTAPQDVALPYVVITLVSKIPYHTHTSSTLTKVRIQISCFGETYYQTKTLSAAVCAALNRYQGTSESVRIDSILLDTEQDLYEDEITHITQDYFVIYGGLP